MSYGRAYFGNWTLLHFPAQQREASVPVRYPDVDKHFLGCYYHEGIFVVSYNRKIIGRDSEKEQMHPQIIPELAIY